MKLLESIKKNWIIYGTRKVNEGIAVGDLRAGFTLTASVSSVQDNGYILSLLPSLTSFLSFNQAKKLQPTRLEVGQVFACRVKEMSQNGKTCTVTAERAEVVGSVVSWFLTFFWNVADSTLIVTKYHLYRLHSSIYITSSTHYRKSRFWIKC